MPGLCGRFSRKTCFANIKSFFYFFLRLVFLHCEIRNDPNQTLYGFDLKEISFIAKSFKEEKMDNKKWMMIGAAAMGIVPFTVQAEGTGGSTASYVPGESVRTGQLPAGYNQTANYKLDNAYDVYFTADFIYWNLQQDLARVGNLVQPDSSGAIGLLTGSDSAIFSDTKYTPGFQVGLGFDMKGMDNWNFYAEYTWYQNSVSQTVHADSGETIVFSFADDAAPMGITNNVATAGEVSRHAKYHYNNVNLSLQRPFYFGRKLTANFGWGLRALWVTQNSGASADDVVSYDSGSSGSGTDLDPASMSLHQKSWALGPRFEFATNWLLGYGLRLTADLGASILYTRYTSLEGSLQGGVIEGITANLSSNSRSGYNTLRGITEASLGLGWGSYFGNNNDFHFDLSASYEFNVYWNQNMAGMILSGRGSPANNYLHGLNVAARFDF